MHATIPTRSSATWRAIVAGREALAQGLLKRIGDGSSIAV
jgi:predicted AlkP superfamily phosphohydrolase/phosphomutase